ncbi:hypothetical protein PGTUg99_024213 [Puccinia graminis f. sp. tritici]|uniref:Uncharacterized protein n=1 Tax=Puccinia graminis f. sp. tritici TaxID=56615 RepID=A0A5B0SLU2_PUCGR|nr:hypothetical protein PGTUg99_024213 [Puccinia graminis f. sp. tritici]
MQRGKLNPHGPHTGTDSPTHHISQHPIHTLHTPLQLLVSFTIEVVCQPIYMDGPFDIISRVSPKFQIKYYRQLTNDHYQLAPVISQGSNYGQLPFETSLGFMDPATNRKVNIGIHACGYGSVATSLQPDRVFRLSGRFLIRNSVPTPIIHFQQDKTLNIGKSKNFMNSLANKVSVIGFGTVVDRNEVTTTTPGNVTSTNLHVTLQHYDYDNLAKEKIEFHATYIVPGNKILGKTFIQFVVGHEIIIDAHVHGYNEDTNRWEFIVGGMAHPSKQAPTPASTPAQSTPDSSQSRRPGFKQIGGFRTPGTQNGSPIASGSGTTPSTSSAHSRHEISPLGRPDFHRGNLFTGNHTAHPPKHQLMSPTHTPRHDPTEDGEVPEPPTSPRVGKSFGSKGPKRASELSILKEAGKISKNLP